MVGADGNQSVVRRLSGIPTWGWNYGAEAIVATISIRDVLPSESEANSRDNPVSSHYNSTAWQKYLPTGPLAVLPLWNGYASIVWSMPSVEAKKMKTLSNSEFLKKLNEVLKTPPKTDRWSVFGPDDAINLPPFARSAQKIMGEPFLGKLKHEVASVFDAFLSAGQLSDPFTVPYEIKHICSPRLSFPLSFQQAKYYSANRVVLLGDAAHSIHPQAGQGLNLAIADVEKLSEIITSAVSSGEDFGSPAVLNRYSQERYRSNLLMMGVVDVLNSIFKDRIDFAATAPTSFSFDNGSFLLKSKQLVRSLGMLGVHNSGQLKHRLAKFAMGID
jgi:ubiquinone biosynthesis monooxygenase Coq6